jgi:hypothetical protein
VLVTTKALTARGPAVRALPSIEAKPAEPEQASTQNDEGDVACLHRLLAEATARSQH